MSAAGNDPIFEEEQKHLSDIHSRIVSAIEKQIDDLEKTSEDMKNDVATFLSEETAAIVNNDDLISFAILNTQLHIPGKILEAGEKELARMQILEEKPYFAKINLTMDGRTNSRDLYIGSSGFQDDNKRHLIIDWRSPVAELYYNRGCGHMEYEVNGRQLGCTLNLRRQFMLERDVLEAYFDTTELAIEDPLLLDALSKQHGDKMRAITATIQEEQNKVIRYPGKEAILVNGIAGSGKTSAMLQRIAYLYYKHISELSSSDVFIFSPNPVFSAYISEVLPELGEANPEILLWRELFSFGYADAAERVASGDLDGYYEALFGAVSTFELKSDELVPLVFSGETEDEEVLGVREMAALYRKTDKSGAKRVHELSKLCEDMLDKKIKTMSKDEETIAMVSALPADDVTEMLEEYIAAETFGEYGKYTSEAGELSADAFGDFESHSLREAQLLTEKMYRERARIFLERKYKGIREKIRNYDFVNWTALAARLSGYGETDVMMAQYLKTLCTPDSNPLARFVMIDEAQDYSRAQILFLLALFPYAQFTFLGDDNQSIRDGGSMFSGIREILSASEVPFVELPLLTSYRSSPEITEVFQSLMPARQGEEVVSISRGDSEPVVIREMDEESYSAGLAELVGEFSRKDGSFAVIVNSPEDAHEIAGMFPDVLTWTDGTEEELGEGGHVLEVLLAKGLEFDNVIIADAGEEAYPEGDDLARRRLYVAVSRAVSSLAIASRGKMTGMLDAYRGVPMN